MKVAQQKGWTFVEMLVAMSLSAIFIGASTLVYSSISANSKRLTTLIEVDIGQSIKRNFYDQNGNTVRVYEAPNYGRAAQAQNFRDLILDDAEGSQGVYALPRSLQNTIRPEFLRYLAGDTGSTLPRPRLDTPEAFRNFLADVEPTSAGIYDTAIRNVTATDRPHTTSYFLSPETDPGYIRVKAIYEIDFVTPTGGGGTYASVRRYKNGSLTHYYDVFYASGPESDFHPVFVAFEHTSRRAVNEGTAIDRFKIAPESPFYLIWLPDPAINPYQAPTSTATSGAGAPRSAYEQMANKSSLVIALPMFPSL